MSMEKHCWAEVNLSALRHNFHLVQAASGGTICAVVKADAYGHGDTVVAQTLEKEGAKAFAVSCLAEGLRLRRAGISHPILILGHTQPSQAQLLIQNNLCQTVYSAEYAVALNQAAHQIGQTLHCHLKLDTGMGRLGFCVRSEQDIPRFVQEVVPCLSLSNLCFEGAFIHFAVADSTEPEDITYTNQQHSLFLQAIDALKQQGFSFKILHCCNSASSFLHPDWCMDWIRPGIILYGHQPSEQAQLQGLMPALSFRTVVTQVKQLLAGQSVSYGRIFTAKQTITVATLAAGYADGYPRQLSECGVVSIHGVACPVIGRVCMDQMLVNVSAVPQVTRGDEAILFGAGGIQTVEQAAQLCQTIPYELLCRISRRVPRLYVDGDSPTFFTNYLE